MLTFSSWEIDTTGISTDDGIKQWWSQYFKVSILNYIPSKENLIIINMYPFFLHSRRVNPLFKPMWDILSHICEIDFARALFASPTLHTHEWRHWVYKVFARGARVKAWSGTFWPIKRKLSLNKSKKQQIYIIYVKKDDADIAQMHLVG